MKKELVRSFLWGLLAVGCCVAVTGMAGARQEIPPPIGQDRLFPVDVNENGETYGSALQADENGCFPVLIRAVGTNGRTGYIRNADIPRAADPEEAVAIMENLKPGDTVTIPLYASDGTTILGDFILTDGLG